MRLQLKRRSSSRSVEAIRKRLPELRGPAIHIRFLPALSAGRSRVYSNRTCGKPVYAATFIRKRRIILDAELPAQPRELARILTHELFHFVWVRLGNSARRSYETLLRHEWKQRARGELGWSAEMRKKALPHALPARRRTAWREYVCESFCDTAAWMFAGLRRHPEFTLAPRHRALRADWFRAAFRGRRLPI